MNLDTYVMQAVRTAKHLPTLQANLDHAAIGVITEVGEIATEIKRVVIYGRPMVDETRAHIVEEIGDVLWYVALACHALRVSPKRMEMFAMPQVMPTEFTMIAKRLGAWAGEVARFDTDHMTPTFNAIGCLIHTLRGLCARMSITLEEAAQLNIDKLRVRYPDAYSDLAAEARADKGGLDARSS